MAYYACKCLNIIIIADSELEKASNEYLELTTSEQRDTFFHEDLLLDNTFCIKTEVKHKNLLSTKNIGRWVVNICLTCGMSTHAVNTFNKTVVVNKSMKTSLEAIEVLKNSEKYSPVFELVILSTSNKMESSSTNINSNNNDISNSNVTIPNAITDLTNKMKNTIKTQLELVEEDIREYRDMKYAEFEAFKERADKDHKLLTSLIMKTRNNILLENKENLESFDTIPQLPPQRRRLSSTKDAKKIKHNFSLSTRRSHPDDDMSDVDDIFDLEGTVERPDDSDADVSDSDADADVTVEERYKARDEHWGHGVAGGGIARSLPMDVPRFSNVNYIPENIYDNEGDPHDIAASIKALAKSVHGDVFGELPRPRFSTQI